MDHSSIVKGYGDLLFRLGKAVKGKNSSLDLTFEFSESKDTLFAVDSNSGVKIAVASRLNKLIPYWQPIDIAYGAMDSICEEHRSQTHGSGGDNMAWRDNLLLELTKSAFSSLNLGEAYSPKS